MSRLTPEELAELRRIHGLAGRRVDSVLTGDYRSAVRGQGMEFEEVRAYIPGDDVRHIDWNVTARTGEPFVKVFREERQLTLQIMVDVSGSSRVGTGGRDGRTDRLLHMARVAGGLAYAGIRSRDRVGLITFTDRIETYLSPRASRGHVWAVIQKVFEGHGTGRKTDLSAALRFVATRQRRRSVIVLLSDFIDGGDWYKPLASLCRRHEVHTMLVHDPLDGGSLDDGPLGLGLVDAVDPETGEHRLVDSALWAASVATEQRAKTLRAAGAKVLVLSTHDDPYYALRRHFTAVGMRR